MNDMADPTQSAHGQVASSLRIAELLNPAAFPHQVTHLQLRETAISWVLLTGIYAYKIIKPVHFDFIDASTLQRRHFLCGEELRLNHRFAPGLYLEVVPIVENQGHIRVAGLGTPIEYAVRMRQFDTSRELASELIDGRVMEEDLAALGKSIGELHRTAVPATADGPFGRPELIRAQLHDNFLLLLSHLTDREELLQLARLERWSQRTFDSLDALLQQRRQSGHVRECHGDLHSGNIVRWRGRYVAFDCLEFEPRLRWIDVISDVAFLFMDLVTHARADLAYVFLSAYLEHNGDYEGLRLLRLYAVYRALVRAKVDALALSSAVADSSQMLRERLRARLGTAMQLVGAPAPVLVLMHGVSGSGKSTVSASLIGAIRAVRVRSDLERRRTVTPSSQGHFQGVGQGPYSADAKQRSYKHLLECAQSALAGGCSIIIDATFLEQTDRQPFEAFARRHNYTFLIVSCTAAAATLRERLVTRSHTDDPSEATVAVLDAQLAAIQPLGEQERAQMVQVDTTSQITTVAGIKDIEARLRNEVSTRALIA